MLIVVALGGNALVHRGEPLAAALQRRRVRQAAQALAGLCAAHRVVITHGNGPQVGLLALQAESYREVEAYPLDVLSAESQGMVGYWLAQELARVCPGGKVVTLLTQVEVDEADPAMRRPTKPIGPSYTEHEAQRLARERGWSVARDGDHWRRVVASPKPLRVIEADAVRHLLDQGYVVVCGGGGGIPVVHGADGWRGVEAVVDKDRTAALLACTLGAERLLILTDVAGVFGQWPSQADDPLRHATPGELSGRSWDAGSMGPKIEAACHFVRTSGREAVIGALEDAASLLAGMAGTVIRPDACAPGRP